MKGELPTVIAFTLSGDSPLFESVSFRSLVWPVVTAPKAREDALRRMAGTGLSNADPLRGMRISGRPGSLLVSDSVPCCDPVETGDQRTVTARCPSGGITTAPPPASIRNG